MEYYILINGLKQGPFSIEELRSKDISRNSMIWRIGQSQWLPANQIPELSNLLNEIPPEPPSCVNSIPPKTWLVESILVTLFCCMPFGIMGIVKASNVESAYNSGRIELALQYSNQAKKWVLWGFFTMLGIIALYILAVIVIAVISYVYS